MNRVKVSGFRGLKAEFASITKDLPKIVDGELQAMAQDWVVRAKKDAPADQAALRGAISYHKSGSLQYEVVSQTIYAPFMEFGTKGKYRPIPGTEAIAAQFKGYRGGDFMELLRNIARWVKRKGIAGTYSVKTQRRTGSKINQTAEDYSVAWPIAISILRNGISPHPYFFKQMDIVWPKFIRSVEKRISNRTKTAVVLPPSQRPKITND